MAIDLTTPTVRPPSSLDLDKDEAALTGADGLAPPTMQTMAATSAPVGGQQPGGQAAQSGPAPQVGGDYRGDSLAQPLTEFAMQTLAQPSRYDMGIVQSNLDLINQYADQSTREGMNQLDEYSSSRGLVGSSVEQKGRTDLLSQIETAKQQRYTDLATDMARTFAQDRAGAANTAISTGNYLGGMDDRDIQREQFAQQLGLSRDQLDLQRDEMLATFEDRALERASRLNLQRDSQEFQSIQNNLDRELENRALQLQRDGLDAESAWREADRALEEELQTRALDLEQQGMSADEAYRQAALQQQGKLSAADIYLRALAAGAGDNADLTDFWQYLNRATGGGETTRTTTNVTGTPPVGGPPDLLGNWWDQVGSTDLGYGGLPAPQVASGSAAPGTNWWDSLR